MARSWPCTRWPGSPSTASSRSRPWPRCRPGESVAVVAVGGVGSGLIQAARAAGADPIIAIDVAAEKLAKAKLLQVVLGLDQKIGNQVVAGNVKYLDHVLAPTFEMTHGNQWINGGTPSLVDNKTSFLARVAAHGYTCIQFDDIKAELHGDVAITYGRYLASEAGTAGTANAYFVVWYERVYQKVGDDWIYLSHRTVNGPHFGATVADAMAGMGPADPNLTYP